MKAKLVKELPNSPSGATRKLWKLDPPLEGHKFVITSAVVAQFTGPETYIFPSNKKGKVIDWMELHGSFRGSLDHTGAIVLAGYNEITQPEHSD